MLLQDAMPRSGFPLVHFNDTCCGSVAELRSEFPRLTYLLAGDGPERSRLDAMIRDLNLTEQVRCLGATDELTKWAAIVKLAGARIDP